jgi:hypothetical protein
MTHPFEHESTVLPRQEALAFVPITSVSSAPRSV